MIITAKSYKAALFSFFLMGVAYAADDLSDCVVKCEPQSLFSAIHVTKMNSDQSAAVHLMLLSSYNILKDCHPTYNDGNDLKKKYKNGHKAFYTLAASCLADYILKEKSENALDIARHPVLSDSKNARELMNIFAKYAASSDEGAICLGKALHFLFEENDGDYVMLLEKLCAKAFRIAPDKVQLLSSGNKRLERARGSNEVQLGDEEDLVVECDRADGVLACEGMLVLDPVGRTGMKLAFRDFISSRASDVKSDIVARRAELLLNAVSSLPFAFGCAFVDIEKIQSRLKGEKSLSKLKEKE